MTFRLVFPFELQPGRSISELESPIEFNHGDLRITLEKFNERYRLIVGDFSSHEAAADYISSIWRALAWMLIKSGFAFTAQEEPQQVDYVDDPEAAAERLEKQFGLKTEGRVDTLLDGGFPAIVQAEKKFKTMTPGTPGVMLSTPAQRAKDLLTEGLSVSAGAVDERLRTAVDLFGAYYTESTPNARLITLVMALETLTTSLRKTQRSLDLLARWRVDVDQAKKSLGDDSDERADLEALERELFFRQERSIRSSLRSFVFETLTTAGDPEALQKARGAVDVYDMRSTLVHEGYLDPGQLAKAAQKAKEIAEAVLRAQLAHGINQGEERHAI